MTTRWRVWVGAALAGFWLLIAALVAPWPVLWDVLIEADYVDAFRVAYTWVAILGLPPALYCGWHSRQTWKRILTARINGGLLISARGYRRRDALRAFSLLAISLVGAFALWTDLTRGSPLGFVLLTWLALRDLYDGLADFRDRRATVDEVLP